MLCVYIVEFGLCNSELYLVYGEFVYSAQIDIMWCDEWLWFGTNPEWGIGSKIITSWMCAGWSMRIVFKGSIHFKP